jgi:hypothetical protein
MMGASKFAIIIAKRLAAYCTNNGTKNVSTYPATCHTMVVGFDLTTMAAVHCSQGIFNYKQLALDARNFQLPTAHLQCI